MEKIKQYKYIIILTIIILCGAFYWYSYRPEQIRKKCFNETRGNTLILRNGMEELQDSYYKDCIMSYGLK